MRWLAVVAVIPVASGCDLFNTLRGAFHPDEGDSPEFGKAGLRVEVDPPAGISILIDGRRVASVSPYVNRKLRAGPHRLEVRAMGYHSVTLPVELVDGALITVPVSLRRRLGTDAIAEGKPEPDVPEAPPPPEPPAPPLPPGVDPIVLQVAAKPRVPIMLDQVTVKRRAITLERTHGEIIVGVARISYRIGGAGLLVVTVAADDAAWSKDGKPLKRGKSFKLHRGSVRLRRVASDGTDQTILLRR
ncbi:MAG: hypothetical protein V3T05_07810 [Myxococcota bacterium]